MVLKQAKDNGMEKALIEIRVECYAGYRGEETPRRFFFKERPVEVVEVLDRWLDPQHRYFKLKGDDQALYIIRHDVGSGQWELTMFDAKAGSGKV